MYRFLNIKNFVGGAVVVVVIIDVLVVVAEWYCVWKKKKFSIFFSFFFKTYAKRTKINWKIFFFNEMDLYGRDDEKKPFVCPSDRQLALRAK